MQVANFCKNDYFNFDCLILFWLNYDHRPTVQIKFKLFGNVWYYCKGWYSLNFDTFASSFQYCIYSCIVFALYATTFCSFKASTVHEYAAVYVEPSSKYRRNHKQFIFGTLSKSCNSLLISLISIVLDVDGYQQRIRKGVMPKAAKLSKSTTKLIPHSDKDSFISFICFFFTRNSNHIFAQCMYFIMLRKE